MNSVESRLLGGFLASVEFEEPEGRGHQRPRWSGWVHQGSPRVEVGGRVSGHERGGGRQNGESTQGLVSRVTPSYFYRGVRNHKKGASPITSNTGNGNLIHTDLPKQVVTHRLLCDG